MAEFNSSDYGVKLAAQPASATLQIVTSTGETDTIELNAQWAAYVVKRLRVNGPSEIGLAGMLPPGSPEITPVNSSWSAQVQCIDSPRWEGWLLGKPGC